MNNFAIIGVAGFVAPRHLRAIQQTGNRLVAAVDPHDAVGILDQFSFDVRFFTEIERFDRQLEKLRRGPVPRKNEYRDTLVKRGVTLAPTARSCAASRSDDTPSPARSLPATFRITPCSSAILHV